MVFDILTKDLPVDPKYPKSCVYWIYHEDKHADPRKEGYVGVCTKGAKYRFQQHRSSAKLGSDNIVHRAMRKYGNKIKIKTLAMADPELCLLLEKELRPSPLMQGTWNINAGGLGGNAGISATREARQKQSASARSRLAQPWAHPLANTDVWALAGVVQELLKDNPSHSTSKIEFAAGIQHLKGVTLCKKIRNGWRPSEDSKWLAFKEQYLTEKEALNAAPTTATA